MSDMNAFLDSSPIAKRTRLSATVILDRSTQTPADLLSIKEQGVYTPGPIDMRACELEIGGKVIARGRVVKHRGNSYFKVTDLELEQNEGGSR